ncbi:uncharacterized protein LOC111325229 [Stylophora pistillata]|uniref:uncharacterized protein LOC111325229 n=1 Tax=Stylophora pistillata TaxID=50429 RepID=UPI000C05076A|nr:uncharacterized protein LOC111325229 [Stylophora pistillata]
MRPASLFLFVAISFVQEGSAEHLNIFASFCAIFAESHSEPDYVTNLKKYFNDGYNTGTYSKKISSKEELENEAKKVFREFLTALKYKDTERFLKEWKTTFTSDGPFASQQDLNNLERAITDPDDFMTSLYIGDLLTNRDDADEATEAYKEAFVSKDNERVALFYLGDDDIMHGVLAAGVRSNMDAGFLVFLID